MGFSASPYDEAGRILTDILKNHKGLKSLVFGNQKAKGMKCSKSTYATVCQTIQHKPILDEILQRNNAELHDKIMKDCRNTGLVYILLYELLFGKYGSIRGRGALKRIIMENEEALRDATKVGKAAVGVKDPPPPFPKYVRLNTLKTSETSHLVAEGLTEHIRSSASSKRESKGDDEEVVVYADAHVPDLLVLPPDAGVDLHSHPYASEGKIIFQDKSSCFPALCLVQGLISESCGRNKSSLDIIDACASPGNKTTHLAALLRQQQLSFTSNKTPLSKVFALDRDSKRMKILQDRVDLLVPTATGSGSEGKSKKSKSLPVQVIPLHMDFLQTKPDDPKFANVKAILVDPSCSGSGMVNQPDRQLLHEENGKQRIESLANFQIVALKHAMSFPQVERIVYSTCSIHEEENEIVVAKALQEHQSAANSNNMKVFPWKISRPTCLDTWKRRGNVVDNMLSNEDAQCMIRCDGLDGDETNGFFVCLLERQHTSTSGLINGSPASPAEKDNNSQILPIYNGEFRMKRSTSTGSNTNKHSRRPAADSVQETPSTPRIGKGEKKRKIKNSSQDCASTILVEQKNEKKQKKEEAIVGSKVNAKKVGTVSSDSSSKQELQTSVTRKKEINTDTKRKEKKKYTDVRKNVGTSSSSNVHDKKKAKKIQWKLKQKEKKQNRLLKKKENSSKE